MKARTIEGSRNLADDQVIADKAHAGPIYVVKVVSGECNLDNLPKNRNSLEWRNEYNRRVLRTWAVGYFLDRAEADRSIHGNDTDMSEQGYYRYAVLAAVPQGLLSFGEEVQWYEFYWKHPKRGRSTFIEARKIVKPPEYKNVFWGMLGD